jgi:hypothetical protein
MMPQETNKKERKINISETHNTPIKLELTTQDTEISNKLKKNIINEKIQNIASNNENYTSNKNAIKNIYVIITTYTILGGIISYLILKNFRNQAKAEKRENIMSTIIASGASIIGMLVSMLLSK